MPEKKETEEEEKEEPEQELGKTKERRNIYGPTAKPPVLRRITDMQSGPQSRIMMKTMKMLQEDMKEMKGYLKEILNHLKSDQSRE